MTPDALLRLYPRQTLRWLRGRLGLSRLGFALHLGVSSSALGNWEARRHGIAEEHRARLAAMLAPQLATAEGAVFRRSLSGEGPLRVAHRTGPGGPTTRLGLREVWRAGGKGWEDVPAEHRGRNLAIARAYLETDAPVPAIAARHGIGRTRVPPIARGVVYATLGQRPPTR